MVAVFRFADSPLRLLVVNVGKWRMRQVRGTWTQKRMIEMMTLELPKTDFTRPSINPYGVSEEDRLRVGQNG